MRRLTAVCGGAAEMGREGIGDSYRIGELTFLAALQRTIIDCREAGYVNCAGRSPLLGSMV